MGTTMGPGWISYCGAGESLLERHATEVLGSYHVSERRHDLARGDGAVHQLVSEYITAPMHTRRLYGLPSDLSS
jgi:hypothetical protein